MTRYVVLPGIGGSGAEHWQSHWERADSRMHRFAPESWEAPGLDQWIEALDQAVSRAAEPPVLVAHSLSCLLVAHWSRRSSLTVRGAFLVALPDPQGPSFPAEAAGFADPPEAPLRFPGLLIASSNDPYGTLEHARLRAGQWSCPLMEAGDLGHINAASALGDWAWGRAELDRFEAGLAR
ncbi:MAG: serine hydrolase family protein [Novosphingobium sp.]|uniref:RBBP9/YdeN family alpha/beta hydrolase n=1 Tax=Novosphingobium sp. TaxID=1874826 RepID=UPI0012CC9FE9|nr:alpha/beta hydrolase [Novosphingobium sp.]MPS68826.1 serine hydrolase family protein [Novosphingobium sp.]